MSKKKLPLSLLMIRGAVGRSFVIKHYKFGIFMTKFPDMTRIVASKKQRIRRDLFAEAVAWAKLVIADPIKKAEWQKRLKRTKRVYHTAIKEFMLRENKKLLHAEQTQLMPTGRIEQPGQDNSYLIASVMKEYNYLSKVLAPVIATTLNLQKLRFYETG